MSIRILMACVPLWMFITEKSSLSNTVESLGNQLNGWIFFGRSQHISQLSHSFAKYKIKFVVNLTSGRIEKPFDGVNTTIDDLKLAPNSNLINRHRRIK